jgi:hypothetical protein
MVDVARLEYSKGEDICLDLPVRGQHFLLASKLFLEAAESHVHLDYDTRTALVYLAKVSIEKSKHVQLCLDRSISPTSVSPAAAAGGANAAVSSKDGPILIRQGRLASSDFKSRITGVKKVPKARVPTEAAVINDMLIMESRLAEIGKHSTLCVRLRPASIFSK